MKKLMFISLLVIPLCEAADPGKGKGWFVKNVSARFKKKPARISYPQETWDDILEDQSHPGYLLATLKGFTGIPELPTEVGGEPLTVIDLSGNQLTALPEKADAPMVTRLWLNCNKIKDINDLHLSNFPQLEEIRLNDNQISKITDQLKHDKLMTLILTGNQIYRVDPEIFVQFPKLIELDLNENPITPNKVQVLKEAAKKIKQQTGRQIKITADDTGDKYLPEGVASTKGTAKK